METIELTYLTALLPEFPATLALLGGIILAIVFWSRYPEVSRLALSGFSILLVCQLLGPYISLWFTLNHRNLGWEAREFGFAMTGVGLVNSILASIAYGLILAAVFGWRNSSSMTPTRRPG